MASFTKNAKGKWSVRFRFIEYGIETHKRMSGFDTKREAEQAYYAYVNEHINGKTVKTENITFEQLFNAYIDYSAKRIKTSTLYDITNRANKHLVSFFENKPVKDITPLDVLNWQHSIDKFAYSYKCSLLGLLHSIFKFGNKYYDLPLVTAKVDRFRNTERKKEMSVWTVEQFQQFLTVVDDPFDRAYFGTLFYGGLRRSEALALQWRDYNSTTHKLAISKSITQKEPGKPWTITSPKNQNSNRTIIMPNSLRELYKVLPKGKANDFIFGGSAPWVQNTLMRKFKRYIAAAELPDIRMHDLRHSCASFLLSSGTGKSLSPVIVAKYLGHTVEMLLSTYAHVLPNGENEIVEKFNY